MRLGTECSAKSRGHLLFRFHETPETVLEMSESRWVSIGHREFAREDVGADNSKTASLTGKEGWRPGSVADQRDAIMAPARKMNLAHAVDIQVFGATEGAQHLV